MANSLCAAVTCGSIGAVMLVTGCVLIHVFNDLIHSEVKDQAPITNGSESYKAWQKPPVPIYFQVWMWDIINYMEVSEKGEKPYLVQLGPYTYREHREKFDMKWNDDKGTVSYRERRSFNFMRNMSVGSENDTFHCINLPMITVATLLRNKNEMIKMAAEAALKATSEELFIKLSVADLMWGYDDPLITDIHKVLDPLHINIPIPAKFGLFAGQNGSDDGVYEIYSGTKGIDNFGEILTWNGNSTVSFWNSDTANAINGSDGTLYHPFISTSETKYLFSSDIGRSLGMDYTERVSNRGIDMDRFVAPEILFGNVSVNPSNAGFCTPPGQCLPSGLLNVSVLRDGAPVVMSMPHFLGCDAETLNSVRGLKPNKDEHSSFLDLEPLTGVVMNAGKKLQLNVYLEKIDGFPETSHLKKTFFPIMWLNESALIDEADASKFKDQVMDKLKLTDAVKYSLIAIGGFILLCVLVLVFKKKLYNSVEKPPPTDSHRLIKDSLEDPVNSTHINGSGEFNDSQVGGTISNAANSDGQKV